MMNPNYELKQINLRNGNYYNILHCSSGKALEVPSNDKDVMKATLSSLDEQNLNQIWMIQQISPHKYQLVHAVSTFVLEHQNFELQMGKWKKQQLFHLQRMNPRDDPNLYWFKSVKNVKEYIYFEDNKLKCTQKDHKDPFLVWEIKLVKHNTTINEFCMLEYAYSNQVLDVPEASLKMGTSLIQYGCNKRFNQLWKLIKCGKYYAIQNARSKLFLDVKKGHKKEGTSIIQFQQNKGDNQLWLLEQQGKRLYIIRSKLDTNFCLGVQDNSLNEKANIILTKKDEESFWRIIGNISQ